MLGPAPTSLTRHSPARSVVFSSPIRDGHQKSVEPNLYFHTTNLAWYTKNYNPGAWTVELLLPFTDKNSLGASYVQCEVLRQPNDTIVQQQGGYIIGSTLQIDFLIDNQSFRRAFKCVPQSLTYSNLQSDAAETGVASHINGIVLASKPFVVVRWPWITLPAALNFIGIAFLGVTAFYTKRLCLP